ncbi:PREDICTED: (S)-scoulerine 9-O-methyltransferase-like [Tarenaya hassleriana]|uniref:(S)-scoulerine 9-O-methyltransferase-like n=1 Tax=Tarenaya hassleriana TaxID=28532 RepID=UPI00053C5844|nr:PREDICTED: (S)-scoulerine 9-O-methyltransferase-like [Tarenaya hassleriana]
MEAPKGGVFFSARELHNLIPFHLTLRAAIELNVFDIIAGAPLTAAEIAAQIPTGNPNASASLDRILRTLAAYGILTVSFSSSSPPAYGLADEFQCLVSSEKSSSVISRAANVLGHALSPGFDSFCEMKHAVLEENTVPFVRAFGVTPYEYFSERPELTKNFNESMANNSKFYIAVVLKTYRGFDGVTELLDVGGGNGTLVGEVIKAYPNIRGLNFDLPFIIDSAPAIPGVEHIAGDMFESIPNAETLMMKV